MNFNRTKRVLSCASALLLCCTSVSAYEALASQPTQKAANVEQNANVIGYVVDAKTGKHIPGMVITIKGTTFATATDSHGHFSLKNVPAGHVTLVMTGVGYRTQEQQVHVSATEVSEVFFRAEVDEISLDEVVVSSNRHATLRRLAPTLVNVLNSKTAEMTNSTNLSQGLAYQPGVRVESNCQNCGFNQVRINGLDGKYSQILIDSRPIFSALNGVYGLEQLPMEIIDHVEVVRGGGSALFGSSAIAGVINIITKEPTRNHFTFNESLTLTGLSRPDNNAGFNASLVSENGRLGAMVYGQNRRRTAWDANGDGGSEIGRLDARTLGVHTFFKTSDFSKLSAELHTLQEYRRGGTLLDLPDHVAPVSERLRHSIYSGNTKFDLFSQDYKQHLQLFGAAQIVYRNSYYGAIGDWEKEWATPGNPVPLDKRGENNGLTSSKTFNAGLQYTYDFDELFFMPAQLLLGAEYLHDVLADRMPIREWTLAKDGKTALYPRTFQKLNNYSQFAQIEWKNEDLSLLLGARLDEQSLLKTPILSPRAALRYAPSEAINLRASYAKGFRAPQIFDEDLHVALANAEIERIYNAKGLRPEISHNFNLSSDFFFGEKDGVQGNILVEGFYTRLNDAFTTEEVKNPELNAVGVKTSQRVNSKNGGKVYGLNLEGKVAYEWAQLQMGFTLAKNVYDSPEEWGQNSTLDGKKITFEDLSKINENSKIEDVAQESVYMTRTPSTYGYFTLSLNPYKPLTFSLTGNYTGSMYVPHEIVIGNEATKYDPAYGKEVPDFKKPEGVEDLRVDILHRSPSFFDLGARLAYKFDLYDAGATELFVGMQNIFNSFQKDYDFGVNRDSAYIYGPRQPRSAYFGLKLEF